MISRERLCLLIADDLTGAADACVKFVTRGCSGTVALTLDAEDVDAEVLAINADTRRQPEAEARRRIREVAGRHAALPPPVAVFKKIDSTLRGHAGAEIDEALQAFGRTHAVITPAFPAMGRTVREGVLFVDGRAICNVRERLAERGIAPAAIATIAATELQTAAAAAAAFARARAAGGRALVCDATSQADLERIVSAALDAGGEGSGERPLWAGSAGLADALAARLSGARASAVWVAQSAATPRATRGGGSLIVFAGSPHPVTQEQQRRLLVARAALATGNLRDALSRGRHVLVPSGFRCSDVLRNASLTAADRARIAGFIMTGGDTAADVCRGLGTTHLRLGGEVEQGVPWGVLRGGIADGLPMVLKSGAFGTPDTLIAALDFLDALDAQP